MEMNLDALIAEKVMGYPPEFNLLAVPKFSSDIAAAWQVVERMHQQQYSLRLQYQPMLGDWEAIFLPEEDEKMVLVSQLQPTPAEAICYAALKALEVPACQ